jgi:hypothetical protein
MRKGLWTLFEWFLLIVVLLGCGLILLGFSFLFEWFFEQRALVLIAVIGMALLGAVGLYKMVDWQQCWSMWLEARRNRNFVGWLPLIGLAALVGAAIVRNPADAILLAALVLDVVGVMYAVKFFDRRRRQSKGDKR